MSPDDGENARLDALLGTPMDLHESDEKYLITKEDVEILRWFKDQTVFTIGTAQTVHVYRGEVVSLMMLSVSSVSRDLMWSCGIDVMYRKLGI